MQQTLKRVLEVERTVAAVAYASSESVAADQQPEPGEEEEAVEPEAVHAEKVHGLVGDGVEVSYSIER